jgi:hypothetical protein
MWPKEGSRTGARPVKIHTGHVYGEPRSYEPETQVKQAQKKVIANNNRWGSNLMRVKNID